ncbi:Fumarylacetoacetase [Hypsibius exemplaris]|uniref:Fumarylacetoacetase n=1 Tax=Hypsibius exemplaris TaxID=2072580 RepID=A0A1W0X9S7_HYPEX|nr:Fumarylacetoacetase [Hypsibius exemplaris]
MADSTFLQLEEASDFSFQNLPFGVFSTANKPIPRIGIAIGNWIMDLSELDCFSGPEMAKQSNVFREGELNAFMGLGRNAWHETRQTVQRVLSSAEGYLRDNGHLQKRTLINQDDAIMHVPARIGDFTDFSASKRHAENDRIMFTDKSQRILPNWDYMPVAYHSRASSVVVSGTDIRRPNGQYANEDGNVDSGPVFGPTKKLDFEMEIGALIGTKNALSQPISVDSADNHVFGFVLLNDWSARDLQSWEWNPLGPFLSKSFATTISPWVVTAAALEPFLCDPICLQDPQPLPYLRSKSIKTYDINLTTSLQTEGQTEMHYSSSVICQSNYKVMYWTLAQQIAHHTSNGCNLLPGDLIGSGTVSGPTYYSSGSLSELSERGTKPITLVDGQRRAFLHDGDEVIIRGWCEDKSVRIGFGECRGRVLHHRQHSPPPFP